MVILYKLIMQIISIQAIMYYINSQYCTNCVIHIARIKGIKGYKLHLMIASDLYAIYICLVIELRVLWGLSYLLANS